MITLGKHQEHMGRFWCEHPRSFNNSDPGTGKTLGTLHGYTLAADRLRMLVVAPLSILSVSWAADIDKLGAGLRWAIAHGSPTKRMKAFESTADIVIINHDGVKWIVDQLEQTPTLLDDFTHLVVDEYTAFKHSSTARTKALARITKRFDYVTMLSGTPNANGILNLFMPAFMLDGGERLGSSFFKFRAAVCVPEQVGPEPQHIKWVERPDAVDVVTSQLSDITIRYELDECQDIPPNTVTEFFVDMPPPVMRTYRQFEQDAILADKDGRLVNAINKASLGAKLLQLLTGAVYDENGDIVKVHPHRYQLVLDLVEERKQCVVAFNWSHEREALIHEAEKRKIPWALIDGSVPPGKQRDAMVEKFQSGKARVIFCHPQSSSHGLTLTRGTSTIWCSPTPNGEHYKQFNARIHRAGQTQRTETIRIAANDTREMHIYQNILDGKLKSLSDCLEMFARAREPA